MSDFIAAIATSLVFIAFGCVGVLLVKRRFGRRVAARLRAIDAGELCSACNGTDVEVAGDVARCRTCGREEDLAAIRRMTFDAETIANVRDLPRGGRAGPR